MLRAADGAAIEGEVWALPTSAVGALLAQVPTPLGFGTVELAEGSCLGFLAEAAGVAGARDITMLRRLARLACGEGRGMSDHDELDAWLDANAALLGHTGRSGMAR